jgi:glycerol-3-phosphate acyltransferase PlsY
VLTVILWVKHRDNIRRLLAGTESRIGSAAGA